MEANCLRIGNYVYFKHCDYNRNEPRVIKYTCNPNLIGLEKVSINRIEFNNIERIPITDDWCFKFGYKKYPHGDALFITGHLILKCNDLFICDKTGVVFKFVDQLQNYVFYLTGNELKIKP